MPDFSAGAMGNLGLISYQESGLLFDKSTASTFDEERVATLIAHKLANQVNIVIYSSSLTNVYIKLDISVNVIVNLDVQ